MLARHLASCGFALKQQLQEVSMDHATLRAAVIDYFQKQLADAKVRRVSLGPYTPKERERVLDTVGMLEEGNIEFWQLVGRDQAEQELGRFFETTGLSRDEFWPHAMRVLDEIRKGKIGAAKEILAFAGTLDGYDFSEAQSGAQAAGSPPAGTGSSGTEQAAQRLANGVSGTLLSDMFAARQAEANRGAEWSAKLCADYSVWVGLFLELAGDRSILSYRKADARAFKEVLQELPVNRTKYVETDGLGPREAVQAGKQHGLAVISTSTVNKALGRLQAIWKWADKQLDDDLPDIFGPMKVAARVNARDEADPFSKGQLKAIFSGPLFTGCKSDRFRTQAGDTNMSGTSWYWLPLLGLYTGARLNELCQLHLTDLDKEDGVQFLHLREGQQGQRIKSGIGRVVPLHPKLIDLGILRYAETQRRGGEERLFPTLQVGPTGYYSDRPSKDFSAYLKGINAKTDKTSFHSFRHGFKDACRSGGVQPDIADILQGHSLHGMSGRYGDGKAPLSVLQEAIFKVSYPGLSLECVRQHP
ncbi:Phage integrase family protein [Roseovarius tolerans]|uniref:Phage integrase family protein n=1 Tax=Roseovarius tolerans TaxID=74031 RepID=A0A1H8AM11_9RHOB|nr:site-specific integrase [Roseovarius tolerans]SEM70878.1 Phage integrase family protein [Roseovarius tolerans]